MSNRQGHSQSIRTNPHAERFVDELRLVGNLAPGSETERVLDAFRHVPREDFAGPGPWTTRSVFYEMTGQKTPDDDPRWLYHCVLVALNEDRGINIGEPSFWARVLSRAGIRAGSRILQVGAGVGYYTALLHLLAGPQGRVLAYEVEKSLAARAENNLKDRDSVEIRHGNAATDLGPEQLFDMIIGFAGVTHVPAAWRDQLAPDGRVLLPMTGTQGWGAMVLAQRDGDEFSGETLGRCGFYPCSGARSETLAAQLDQFWAGECPLDGGKLRFGAQQAEIAFEALSDDIEGE